MALPNSQYIAFQGVETLFRDKITGLPLANGSVQFFSDVARTVPKNVYQQVQLPGPIYSFVSLGSIVTLTSIGSFGDNNGVDIQVYAFPYDASGAIELYYMAVYDQNGSLQFTREAQPANVSNTANIDTFAESENQIENPQFVDTFQPVSTAHVYTVSGAGTVTPIAPDWSIITTGSGTVTVTQEALTDIAMPTGAPYAIHISSTGVTGTVQLRQRITQSPRILGSGFIFGSFVAKSYTASDLLLTMDYVASNAYTVNLVTATAPASGSYTTLSNATATAIATTNSNSPETPGYVDIIIGIPALAEVGITSVQLVSTKDANSISEFIQESVPRQIDHLFHYYKPQLAYKPIPSYLVGWDFPLNPAQISATQAASAIGANKSKYVWDQTIIFQSADSGVGVTRGTAGELLLTAAATTQMAIIQYLDQIQARKILNAPICVNVSAKASAATVATVSLWYTTDASLPDVTTGTNNSLVLTLDANGKLATPNGSWTEVPRVQGNAQFTIGTSTTTNFNDYSFNGWDMSGIAAANTATFFAIVVGTASVTTPGTVGFNSVSLQAGNIATRPAPQTYDEVLRECRYFYETSFAPGTVGTAVVPNLITAPMTPTIIGGNIGCYANSFGYQYNVIKRASPTLTFYSGASTTAGKVEAYYYGSAGNAQAEVTFSTYFTAFTNVSNVIGFSYQGLAAGSMVGTAVSAAVGSANILYHFVADSRLGVI